MEKLHISPTKTREVIRAHGTEVLLLTYPSVSGDTPAARHAAALVGALVHYAKNEVASAASTALRGAMTSGRLFDFERHTYDVTLTLAPHKCGVWLTLSTRHVAGDAPPRERALTLLWDPTERVQLRARRHKF